jgi:hypothetical protein
VTAEQKILFESIFYKYNTMLLTKDQMAELSNITIRTLDRHREKGKGCEYRYEGGRVYYPIHKVVVYLDKYNKTVY